MFPEWDNRCMPYIRLIRPMLGTYLHQRDKSPEHVALKINEIMCRRLKVSGEGKSALIEFMCRFTLPQDLAPKQEVEKYLEHT